MGFGDFEVVWGEFGGGTARMTLRMVRKTHCKYYFRLGGVHRSIPLWALFEYIS